MQKLEKSLRNEIIYLLCNTVIFSVIMQAVFLLLGKWDYTVITGNVLGAVAIMLYYYFLALTIESAIKKNENDVKGFAKMSQTGRLLLLFAVCAVGIALPYFNSLSVVIPLLFPRISLIYRPLFEKKMKLPESDNDGSRAYDKEKDENDEE